MGCGSEGDARDGIYVGEILKLCTVPSKSTYDYGPCYYYYILGAVHAE